MNASKTTKSLFLLVSTLALAAPLPVFAEKGGKGGKPGGGGGEDPPAVELVPAPVAYQVTWINTEPNQPVTDLWDVNAAGVAVGWHAPDLNSAGNYADARGFMADADGNQWNLNDYFAVALQTDYPGWRLGFALAINRAGQIACLLVPDDWNEGSLAPAITVALGDIYAETPSLITVEEYPTGFDGWGVADLNEEGDVLLDIDGIRYLSQYPFTGSPVQMPIPSGMYGSVGYSELTNDGEVIFSAWVTTTTTSTRGKKTVTSTTNSREIYFWDSDGSLQTLGEFTNTSPSYFDGRAGLSDSGNVYANVDGIAQGWSPATGSWQPIAPSGLVENFSKAIVGEDPAEEVVIWSGSGTEYFIHQSGYGTFPITVTSGLNGAQDVIKWNEQLEWPFPNFMGISRPSDSGSGCLCGWAKIPRGDSYTFSRFILMPTAVE